jgi:hypothetical protein
VAVVLTFFSSVFITNSFLPSAMPLWRLQLESVLGWRRRRRA